MINFQSNDDLSILFFGGKKKIETREQILNELGVPEVFKSGKQRGQIKYRNVKKEIYIEGFGLKPKDEWKLKKEGFYSTDEKVLKQVAKRPKTDAGKVALLMLQLREKQKLLGTYYSGFEDLIYPDSCIRGNIGHVATDTGRTNSSRPNLQNVPK